MIGVRIGRSNNEESILFRVIRLCQIATTVQLEVSRK